MAKAVKKPVAPIYAAAAVWLIWGLCLPLYRFWHFVLVIAVSAAVYLIAGRIRPGRFPGAFRPKRKKGAHGEAAGTERSV